MQESPKPYAVGLDVGTTTVRCVVGHLEDGAAAPTIIGIGAAKNSGMRKGVVVNIVNTAQAIDKALEAAERMSGHHVDAAIISINGSHIVGMSSKGVVAVGAQSHEITEDDLARAEEAATVVQLPANREILQVTPRGYQLDGQENIKDPLGMTGVRLEVDAHVITALVPHVKNLQKAFEMTETHVKRTVPAGLAAARAVLSDQQMENGVVLIDFGGTTTNVAVFEEGDLQHVAVLPVGSMHVTNDLAIGLKTDLDVAEAVKLQHVSVGSKKEGSEEVSVEVNGESHSFSASDVQEIAEARLDELFEMVNAELKSIGKSARLPGGVVIVGGGAELKGIAECAKEALQLPARVGRLSGFSGVADNLDSPAYAAALGLMLLDIETLHTVPRAAQTDSGSYNALGGLSGKLGNLFKRFRA